MLWLGVSSRIHPEWRFNATIDVRLRKNWSRTSLLGTQYHSMRPLSHVSIWCYWWDSLKGDWRPWMRMKRLCHLTTVSLDRNGNACVCESVKGRGGLSTSSSFYLIHTYATWLVLNLHTIEWNRDSSGTSRSWASPCSISLARRNHHSWDFHTIDVAPAPIMLLCSILGCYWQWSWKLLRIVTHTRAKAITLWCLATKVSHIVHLKGSLSISVSTIRKASGFSIHWNLRRICILSSQSSFRITFQCSASQTISNWESVRALPHHAR